MACLTKLFRGALVFTTIGLAAAQAAEPADKAKEEAKRAVRLKLLRQVADRVQVSLNTGDKPQPVKILAEPLYRYTQDSRNFPDAAVFGWGDGGRPIALLTLACFIEPNSKQLIYEFDSLSAKPLVCTIDGQERWLPRGPGAEMKILESAPKPADDKAGRLRQIDALLARFKSTEIMEESGQKKTLDLAWTAKPVYCYSEPKAGIVDGAICFACIETNPEVLLVLEAQRRQNDPPCWCYGFNRVTYAELHVQWDDTEVWSAPGVGGTSSDGAYHLIPVTMRR